MKIGCNTGRSGRTYCTVAMLGVVLMMGISGSVLAQQEPASDLATVPVTDRSDEQLLQAIDDARFTEFVGSITILVVAETPDEIKEATIRLRFKMIDGDDASRIEFLAPEELAGQIYLTTGDATFFIGPDLDFPLQVQPTSAVFGDAAVAQTSGIRFADEYTVAERRTVITETGQEVIELDLEAIDFTVAFQLATVKIDPETGRAISTILYAISGLPFYEVFYDIYDSLAGQDRAPDEYARVQRIVNLLLVGNVTTTEIVDVSAAELPDELFDPDLLAEELPGTE